MDTSRFLVAPFVLLLIAGFTAAATLAETINGSSLDCTNDFDERMFCQFQAQHCAQHTLKLRSNTWHNEKWGRFQPCGTGQGCCCSVIVGEDMIIMGDTLTATVRNDAGVVESKQVPITGSVKPKAPTIVSVKQSNGNFQLFWDTNTKSNVFDQTLSASVTYYKKGSTEKVTKRIDLSEVNGSKFYEIPGRDLEPSTTYMVSVRSYASWSGRQSDSSQEWEFTTGMSSHVVLLAVVVSLSVLAVMVTAATFRCSVQLKKKWWDTVAGPKLRVDHPAKMRHHGELLNQLLKPEPPVMSPVDVVHLVQDKSKSCPQQSDTSSGSVGSSRQSSGVSTGVSTGSSAELCYAITEPVDIRAGVQNALSGIFPSISPASPATNCPLRGGFCSPRANDTSSGSSGMDNRSYSLVIPGGPQQDPPSEGDAAACAEQHALARLLSNAPAAPLMLTDASYRQCRADSAYAEDSSLSSVSSGSNTAASSAPCPLSQDEAMVCDENPCYGHVPAGPRSFPPVADSYQAFQHVTRKPEVLTSAEGPVALLLRVPGGQCLPELRRPLNALSGSSVPVIVSSGYQSV